MNLLICGTFLGMPYGQMLIEANSECHLFLPCYYQNLRSGFTTGLDLPTVS